MYEKQGDLYHCPGTSGNLKFLLSNVFMKVTLARRDNGIFYSDKGDENTLQDFIKNSLNPKRTNTRLNKLNNKTRTEAVCDGRLIVEDDDFRRR